MTRTILLASFVEKCNLYEAIEQISTTINISKRSIFVFINENNTDEYIFTYNMYPEYANIKFNSIWKNTISIHRKKQTNTLYSLNAMNELIKNKNGGFLNSNYMINWEQYRNKFLIIKMGKVISIPIRLIKLNQ